MNSFEVDDPGAASLQAKPCTICRRRKVRCDKLQPCSNCARAKQVCTYETSNSSSDGTRPEASSSQSGDNDLRDRLARLEHLMATMMVSKEQSAASTSRGSPEVANQPPLNTSTRASSSPTPQGLPPHPSSSNMPQSRPSEVDAPTGQIVFQEGYSGYYDPDFWPGLITEVEDLRQLFETEPEADSTLKWASYSAVGIVSPLSGADSALAHPTIEESNLLCKYFFECVNPFIRVLHQALFARDLDQYRRGTFLHPTEFEALLFTIYTLTVSSLRSEVVEKVCGCSKDALLPRFKYSTQVSLAKINFLQSNKVDTLKALLHYIQNLYKDGVALLGSAAHLARNLGMHKDPSHFPFSPWVFEIRRRAWNHLCVLDAIALTSYGAESCLPATSDSRPPQNANDSDWHASRFAKPSSVPTSAVGFKDMTFALVHRELADMSRELAMIYCHDLCQKDAFVDQVEESLTQKYLTVIDTNKPSQTIVAALIQVRLASVRLSIKHRRSMNSESIVEKQKVFTSAIELLEAYEYHSATYISLNWGWVFQTTVPWLALAIVLTELPKSTQQTDIERAQLQIENYFQRFSDPSAPVSGTAMWKMLVRLRQNMEQSSSPTHVAVSSVRGSIGPSPDSGAAPSALIFTDDLMVDFGNDAMGDGGVWNNDQLVMQDGQGFPWLGDQMSINDAGFIGYRNEPQY
ncbi:uncharacterized protein PAC_09381 [Phialocephala subalpina]|uniref:Zn(2)-C6 fungal-type domain-containing protein n=1 Tax=Phialocephala subalpina TaxID=576137 RepID=A0A1L7X389_9HELO|nr:uncharacterized protein PAC_09381 [Phialocephala subalpina]